MNLALRSTVVWPRHPAWFIATAAASFAGLVIFVLVSRGSAWQPGRFGGLTAGTIAAVLFVNAALYPARRKLRARPLGNAQRWLQLHIYGASFATFMALVHTGFQLPVGTFGWLLFLLTLWTGLTGLVGVYLQKAMPRLITRNLQVEALYERVPALVEHLAKEADESMTGAAEVMDRAYRASVRGILAKPQPSWSYVFDPVGNQQRRLEPLAQLQPFIGGADRDRVDALTGIIKDKLDLDAHLSLQRAMRAWLVLHVPAAALLIGMLVVHVFAVVYF